MKIVFGGIGTALLLVTMATAYAQNYPRWFLFPDELGCGSCAIGMARTPYYPDSSGGEAFASGVENAVRGEEVVIEGTKKYGVTDAGVTAISTTVREVIDTARIESLAKVLKLLDINAVGEMTVALVGPGDGAFPDSLKQRIGIARTPPPWLAALPQDSGFIYALGMSEPAYYEFSAWLEAEKHARLELAKSVQSTVHGIDRLESAASGDEAYSGVQDEKISVALHHAQVVRRWRDPTTHISSVLIRMPR